MKFQITRTDINKIVVRPHEFRDEAAALGEYMSCLMIAGVLPFDAAAEPLGEGRYRLRNGWMIQVSAA